MKKAIKSVLICSLALCSLASCSKSKEKSDSKAESKTPDIVGRWEMEGTDTGYGLIFTADGKGSIYSDTSSTLHFTAEGPSVAGTVISDKYIKQDGDTLTIDVNGSEMFIMSRTEAGEGYDGKYALTGGIFYDRYREQMQQGGEGEDKKLDIEMDFDGDKSEMVINDIFSYEIDDKTLTVSGFSGFLENNGEPIPAEYKIEGDTLSIIDSKTTVTLKKAQ